jgi:hypothetical protein
MTLRERRSEDCSTTNDQVSAYDPQNNAATVPMLKTPPADLS